MQTMSDDSSQLPSQMPMPDGDGSEPETISRELSLVKDEIDRIQATERANNSNNDLVLDILHTASNEPRGRSATHSSGTLVSSTSQNSASSDGVTNVSALFYAEYDTDGMLQVDLSRRRDGSNSSQRISTNDQEASVDRQEGFPTAGWAGIALQTESDAIASLCRSLLRYQRQ